MARRGKSNGDGQQHDEAAEHLNGGTSVERLDDLPNIAARIDSAKAQSDEARSDLGHIYHQAEEDGFHRRALKEAVRLRNMEPDKRRDYLASLNAYCDKLGIWNQGELLEEQPRPPQPDVSGSASALTEEELRERSAEANQDAAGYTHEVGRQAGLQGQTAVDNPWPEGTKAYGTWHTGLLQGLEERANSTVGKSKRGRRKATETGGEEAQVH